MKYKIKNQAHTTKVFVEVDGVMKEVRKIERHPRPNSPGAKFGTATIKLFYE